MELPSAEVVTGRPLLGASVAKRTLPNPRWERRSSVSAATAVSCAGPATRRGVGVANRESVSTVRAAWRRQARPWPAARAYLAPLARQVANVWSTGRSGCRGTCSTPRIQSSVRPYGPAGSQGAPREPRLRMGPHSRGAGNADAARYTHLRRARPAPCPCSFGNTNDGGWHVCE